MVLELPLLPPIFRLQWWCLVPTACSKGSSMAIHAQPCNDASYFRNYHRCPSMWFLTKYLCTSALYLFLVGGLIAKFKLKCCSWGMLLELRTCWINTSRERTSPRKTTLLRKANWRASTSDHTLVDEGGTSSYESVGGLSEVQINPEVHSVDLLTKSSVQSNNFVGKPWWLAAKFSFSWLCCSGSTHELDSYLGWFVCLSLFHQSCRVYWQEFGIICVETS